MAAKKAAAKPLSKWTDSEVYAAQGRNHAKMWKKGASRKAVGVAADSMVSMRKEAVKRSAAKKGGK